MGKLKKKTVDLLLFHGLGEEINGGGAGGGLDVELGGAFAHGLVQQVERLTPHGRGTLPRRFLLTHADRHADRGKEKMGA